MLRAVVEFFQPQDVKCLRCGGAYFDRLEDGLCPMCALYAHRAEPGDLSAGLVHREGISWAGAAWRYGEGVRHRVYALKYGGARRLGGQMGRDMAKAPMELPVMPDALVPVPLHWTRRLSRGFNQAEVLARGLAAQTGLSVDTRLLKRRRRTRRNALLDHGMRLSNVSGAFALTGDVRGLRLLLIDDVLTTGSTASQCARVLAEGGAAWVGVLTYARAGGGTERDEGAGEGDMPLV